VKHADTEQTLPSISTSYRWIICYLFKRVALPAHQESKGEESSLSGALLTPFTYTVNVDQVTGDLKIATIASDFEYNGYLDTSLQVRDSVFVFKNQAMIQFLGHDKRVTKFDANKKLLEIKYFLNGALKESKKIPYDLNTVDSDTLLVFLQEMLLKQTGNFNMDLIQKAKGLRVNANFTMLTGEELQKNVLENNFPEQFKKLSQQPEEVYVYVMKLTGIPGFIYHYKYYFVYRKEAPYQLVAYWGGAPKEEEFGYILE
jgi:hypothetical protein